MKHQVRASAAMMALAVLVMAGFMVHAGNRAAGVLTGAVGLAVAGGYAAWALRRGRHTPWTQAEALVAPGRAVVFWKPSCPYCERLLRAIGRDERVTWVNVWHDDAAQRRCCELNDGNEYTPTALVGSTVLRNPSAEELRGVLDER